MAVLRGLWEEQEEAAWMYRYVFLGDTSFFDLARWVGFSRKVQIF
ncbi:MAG: hypothetical protein ABDK93_06570 [Atribacterota bacterium]